MIISKRELKKALHKAYRWGRKEGYDKGFELAKMIYTEIAAEFKAEVEELNNEIILGEADNE